MVKMHYVSAGAGYCRPIVREPCISRKLVPVVSRLGNRIKAKDCTLTVKISPHFTHAVPKFSNTVSQGLILIPVSLCGFGCLKAGLLPFQREWLTDLGCFRCYIFLYHRGVLSS